MTSAPIKPTDLRLLVRDVLKEVLAGRPAGKEGTSEAVRIGGDADLASFVVRLIERLGDPAFAARIRDGRHRFVLEPGAKAARIPAPSAAQPIANGTALGGVITESKIARFAKSGTIVLAPDAVLTPLARDRARSMGLKIERRR